MQGVIGSEGKTVNLTSLVDIENSVSLTHYLRENGYCEDGMPGSYTNMQGGVSCKTVLIHMGEDRQSMVFKQALSKLRVEADWYTNEGRLLVEAKGLQWIAELIDAPVTPDFLFYDEDAKILAMKAIAEPHQNWKESLLSGSIVSDLFTQFGELLANIHHSAFLRQQNVNCIPISKNRCGVALVEETVFWLRITPSTPTDHNGVIRSLASGLVGWPL